MANDEGIAAWALTTQLFNQLRLKGLLSLDESLEVVDAALSMVERVDRGTPEFRGARDLLGREQRRLRKKTGL